MRKLIRYNKSMAKKYTVLMVDDDKFLLEMHRKKFKDAGCEVDVAVGSEEALRKLRDGAAYDIILLDVIMPNIDGIDLLEIIRKEKLSPDAAVIMLTNESEQDKINEARNLGVSGYIVKAAHVPSEVVAETLKIADDKFKD